MNKTTQNLINRTIKKWDKLRKDFTTPNVKLYGTDTQSRIGILHWDNPNLLWVLITNNEEGYEGSQTQLGLTKDGQLVWEYQSHCSCDGYEHSSNVPNNDFCKDIAGKKSYELEGIPLDWEEKMQENLKKILDAKNK